LIEEETSKNEDRIKDRLFIDHKLFIIMILSLIGAGWFYYNMFWYLNTIIGCIGIVATVWLLIRILTGKFLCKTL